MNSELVSIRIFFAPLDKRKTLLLPDKTWIILYPLFVTHIFILYKYNYILKPSQLFSTETEYCVDSLCRFLSTAKIMVP